MGTERRCAKFTSNCPLLENGKDSKNKECNIPNHTLGGSQDGHSEVELIDNPFAASSTDSGHSSVLRSNQQYMLCFNLKIRKCHIISGDELKTENTSKNL